MTRLNVNPTRMELKRLKARLKTAERGHKLLKDKSDEMVRRFSVLIKEVKELRDTIDDEMGLVLKEFSKARSLVSVEEIELAFSMPTNSLMIETDTENIMSVDVPSIKMIENKKNSGNPYAFASITSEIDNSSKKMENLMAKLVRLSEVEKSAAMLAQEIEKNKRRVNALEYVMIPQLEETIKYIKSKLEENERSNTIRLIKVKSFITED